MEFRAYLDVNGYLKGHNVLWHGPRAPGTMLTHVPAIRGKELRHGVVVAVHSNQVDVLWHDYTDDPTIEYGELKKKLGVPSPSELRALRKQRSIERWQAKKLERERAASSSSADTST